jgi:hypothetical protein
MAAAGASMAEQPLWMAALSRLDDLVFDLTNLMAT